ncbi:TPA: hypothetical protein HA234_01705 [Candidatus Woesearchaeota archaeon]|nr:hypothetical protein [Candidatus Woesearchaeota archaeon]HIG92894.1 hypothetical protein [Candidatus Woesearchaeota archaeon]
MNLHELLESTKIKYSTAKGNMAAIVRYATIGIASLMPWYGCGEESKQETECSSSHDCLDNCLEYAVDTACNYSNPKPGEVEDCQNRGKVRCNELYSSGQLHCGRSCGERTVETEHGPRSAPYCENACLTN